MASIAHSVRFMPQPTAKTCWFASLCMVIEWELRRKRSLAEEARGLLYIYRNDWSRINRLAGDEALAKIARNVGLRTSSLSPEFTGADPFGIVTQVTPRIDIRTAIISRILRRGPFVMPCLVPSRKRRKRLTKHTIVVWGIDDERKQIALYDPADFFPYLLNWFEYKNFIGDYPPQGGRVFGF